VSRASCRLGLTQVEAANQLKLTPRAVQHYENGTRGISDQIAMLTFAVEKRFWRGKHKSRGTHDFYDPRDIVPTPQSLFDRETRAPVQPTAFPMSWDHAIR
jgi:hypothetical protein